MVNEKTNFVNPHTSYSNKLALTSGEKVRKRKFAPPPPPTPIIFIGKHVSLEMTLAEYEITPNAATLAKIGGAK